MPSLGDSSGVVGPKRECGKINTYRCGRWVIGRAKPQTRGRVPMQDVYFYNGYLLNVSSQQRMRCLVKLVFWYNADGHAVQAMEFITLKFFK